MDSDDPSAGHSASYDRHDTLWSRYVVSRDPEARNDLVVAYRPVVARVVQMLPRDVHAHWDSEDLESFGLIGLMDAIERWYPACAVARFETYASIRVRGAIYDALRSLDWLPRRLRRAVVAYRSADDDLLAQLGREPTHAEVLEAVRPTTSCSDTELLAAVASGQLLHIDWESASRAEDIELVSHDPSGDPERRLEASVELIELYWALGMLPERQRTVITLYFLSGLSQLQVAAVLGLSESRVCQITAAGLSSLRKLVDGEHRFSRAS